MNDQVSFHPITKAVALKISQDFEFDILITHAEMEAMLEVPLSEAKTIAEYIRLQWLKRTRVQDLVDRLLLNHSLMLKNVMGEGYKLIRPKEQSSVAVDGMYRTMKAQLIKTMTGLVNIQHDQLNAEEEQENQASIQRVVGLGNMVDRDRKLHYVEIPKLKAD